MNGMGSSKILTSKIQLLLIVLIENQLDLDSNLKRDIYNINIDP